MRIGLSLVLLAAAASAEGFSEDDLRQEFAELKASVAQALDMPPEWKVGLRVVRNDSDWAAPDPAELDSSSRRRLAGRRRLFEKLGLTGSGPRPQDRKAPCVWYDQGSGEVFVVASVLLGFDPRTRRVALLHELIHAYRFGAEEVSPLGHAPLGMDFDRAYAELCTVEGDASLLSVVFQWGLDEERRDLSLFTWIRKHREVAKLFEESNRAWAFETADAERLDSAPYRAGYLFSFEVFAEGGLDRLRATLRDPPGTMEQVLHPEKYLAETRETPTQFVWPEPPDPIAEGWQCIDFGILGEYHLRMALQAHLSRERAEQACAGWDGSIYQLYAPADEGRCLLALITSWDRETDAMEFAEAWQEMAKLRDGKESVGVNVERRGRKVLVLDSTNGLDCAPIREAFWKTKAIAGTRAR